MNADRFKYKEITDIILRGVTVHGLYAGYRAVTVNVERLLIKGRGEIKWLKKRAY